MTKVSTEKIRKKLQQKLKNKIQAANIALIRQRRNALSEDCMQFFRDCCHCCGCFVCGDEESEQVRITILSMKIEDISTGTYFPGGVETPIDCKGLEQDDLLLYLNENETAWGVSPVYGAECTPFSDPGCTAYFNPTTGEWEGYLCYGRTWQWVFSPSEGWHWEPSPYDSFSYSISCSGPTPLSLLLGDCYRFQLSTNEFLSDQCWRSSSAEEPKSCSCCNWVYEKSPYFRCDCCNQNHTSPFAPRGKVRFTVTCVDG